MRSRPVPPVAPPPVAPPPAPPTATFGLTQAQIAARAFSPRSDPMRMMRGAVLAADLAVVLAASGVAHLLRYGLVDISLEIGVCTLLAAVLLGNVLKFAGCYGRLLTTPVTTQIGRALQGWCAVFVALLLFAYLTRTSEQFSRIWVTTWFSGTVLGLVAVRVWVGQQLDRWRRRGKLVRTVAVVDLDGRGTALARSLLKNSAGEVHLLGVFTTGSDASRQNRVEDLLGLARLFRVDDVVVAADDAVGPELDALVVKLGAIPGNIRLSLPVPAVAVPLRDASLLFGHPMLTLCSRPLGDWAKVVKRMEDLLLSTLGFVLVLPVLLVVAVLIKLDSPGPVLFRQRRLGFNNNVITVWKFRTMTHRPDAHSDVSQAKRADPRTTRVGRVLRRTSLDELPQLINVMRGDMSLVGPRPHALAHNEQYAALIDGYLGRHRVQPGITGWAQVNGFRGETDTLLKMQRRVEYDLAYTDNWSLALDIRILVMTVFTTLADRNAY